MISAFFGKIWGYVLAAAGILAAVAAFWFKAKSEGRQEERAEQTERIHEKVEKADKVRRDQRTGSRKRVSKFDRNR